MFRRADSIFKRLSRGAHGVSTIAARPTHRKRIAAITALGVVVGGGAVCYNSGLIHNDVSVASQSVKKTKGAPTSKALEQEHPDTLHSLIWGSNRYFSSSCLFTGR
jgi:6,7-dimethyl-8-ribityllumazine synthase